MGRVRIQLEVAADRLPLSAALARDSSWAEVTRAALALHEWATREISRGGRVRLVTATGEDALVVIPGLEVGGTTSLPPVLPGDVAGETSEAGVLKAVQLVVSDATRAAAGGDPKPRPVPAELRAKDEAIAALQAAVWWAGGPGVPDVPLGRHHAQRARLNTAPVAVLSAILISPGASKRDLDVTVAWVMSEIGGKVPATDSVGFWTSPRMQQKHGYRIEREGDQYRYIDGVPD